MLYLFNDLKLLYADLCNTTPEETTTTTKQTTTTSEGTTQDMCAGNLISAYAH